MRNRKVLLFVLLACLIVALAGWSVTAARVSRSAAAWEYKAVDKSAGTYQFMDADKMLNAHGALGWELVAVQGERFYFKRPK